MIVLLLLYEWLNLCDPETRGIEEIIVFLLQVCLNLFSAILHSNKPFIKHCFSLETDYTYHTSIMVQCY